MKKLMIILMMMLITVMGTSQKLGDSYEEFIKSGKVYKTGTDENGKGYLMETYTNVVSKYYFDDGVCSVAVLMTSNEQFANEVFDRFNKNVVRTYKNNKGLDVYISSDNSKLMYYYRYLNNKKIYIIQIDIF
jgi:hypothetical protein